MDRISTSRTCFIGVFAACGLLFLPGVRAEAEEDVVATVNGHNITLPEFHRSLLECRAAVFGDFLLTMVSRKIQRVSRLMQRCLSIPFLCIHISTLSDE